jgi:hypothetical protein
VYIRKKNITKAIRLSLTGIDVRNLSCNNKIRLAIQIRDILGKFEISEPFTIIPDTLIVKWSNS